jgi:hypothetical protein
MPFRPPFFGAGKQFIENTSSSTIESMIWLFEQFLFIHAKALFADPFRRGYPLPIGSIHRYQALEGANNITMVMMFVGLLWWG